MKKSLPILPPEHTKDGGELCGTKTACSTGGCGTCENANPSAPPDILLKIQEIRAQEEYDLSQLGFGGPVKILNRMQTNAREFEQMGDEATPEKPDNKFDRTIKENEGNDVSERAFIGEIDEGGANKTQVSAVAAAASGNLYSGEQGLVVFNLDDESDPDDDNDGPVSRANAGNEEAFNDDPNSVPKELLDDDDE